MNTKNIVIAVTDGVSAGLIRGQAERLISNGFTVHILSSYRDTMDQLCRAEGANFHIIPFKREISFLNDLKCLLKVFILLKKLRPTVVNAGTPKAGLLCMVGAYLVGVPIRIFTLRGLRSSNMSGIKGKIVRKMESISCSLATTIVPISPSLKEEALHLKLFNERKGKVLGMGSSNGVDISKFNRKYVQWDQIRLMKSELSIADDDIVVGFVGRLVKSKGVEVLVTSFRSLCLRHGNLKLVLVGKMEDEDSLSQEILTHITEDPNILYLGRKDRIHTIIPIFDILVLPSFREGFGNTLIEASALGLPVIASDISGCRDAVANGKSGILVEKGNPAALAQAIEVYLDNPELKALHGEYGYDRAINFFSRDFIHAEQLKLYNSLLNDLNHNNPDGN